MPIRWIINPAVIENGVLKPLVSTIRDPGILLFEAPDDYGNMIFCHKNYRHESIIHISRPWALSFVCGVDLSGLNRPDFVNILERDYKVAEQVIERTPREDGWSQSRVTRLLNNIISRGGFTDLTRDDPIWMFIRDLGRVVWPWWLKDPRDVGHWAS